MKRRHITPLVLESLQDTPVVFIRGPRQAGKTTLVQHLREEGHDATYLTFDEAAVLAPAQSDPDAFVAGLPARVILDEVQRVPELFRAIKLSVDRDRTPGRFVLTGSANALVLPGVSESLAGRMDIITLRPFSQGEREGKKEGFVDACFAAKFSPASLTANDDSNWPALTKRIVAGGFPEACERMSAARRSAWFDAYITTILERDVRDIANIQGLRDLPHLLKFIATRASGLLNLANLSRDAALPQTTLQRYWSLLEATFLINTLPAWSASPGARLVKAPKVFLNDTGLLCALLDIDAARLQAGDLMAGAVLESFAVQELVRQAAWSKTRAGMFHFRTHTQQEVDIVLEDGKGRLVGIEVKKTASPSAGDFKGLKVLQAATGKRFLRGILLYTGTQGTSFAPDLHAMPVSALWQLNAK
jgi:predicted AAA+ superfamily ATPase